MGDNHSTERTQMEDNEATTEEEAFLGVTSAGARDFKLGFALVLLKSKPPAITLRDHVSRLRRHIKQGRRVDLVTYEHRHLDGLQFWKEQYDILKTSEIELKKKVYALEKQNELLTEQLRALSATTVHPRKRRRSDDIEGMNNISNSWEALRNNPIPRAHLGLGSVDDIETVFNAFDPVADAVPLIFHIRSLHQLMNSSNFDISGLSAALICASSSMARVLSSVCARIQGRKGLTLTANTRQSRGANRAESLSQEMEDQQIGEVIRVILKIFKYLLKGLDIVTSSDESISQGDVIYSFVKLFADVMDCLSVRPTMENSTKGGHSASAPKKLKCRGGISENSLPVTPRAEGIRMRLSQLLINMIAVLDPTRKGNAELYEGFQFVLLTRLGQRISFFVFGEELANSPLDGLRGGGLNGKSHSEEQDAGSRQEEAWYLIWLLERVMVDLYDSNPACRLFGRITDTSRGRDGQSLVDEAKARMRSTLLRGVFGDDVEEFNGLRMPALFNGSRSGLVDNRLEEPKARFCSPEFFVQEAWRLIGWQVLAGEDLL